MKRIIDVIIIMVIVLPAIPLRAQESVNLQSGRLAYEATDLSQQAGAVSLELRRVLAQENPGVSGALGVRWRLNWEKHLTSSGTTALIDEPEGRFSFTRNSLQQEFMNPSGEKLDVMSSGEAVRTRTDGTTEKYSAAGRLVEINFRNGNTVSLLYDGKGGLASVKGPRGNFIEFTTDDKGRAVRAEGSSGTKAIYSYESDNLVQVTINGRAITYSYDAAGNLIGIAGRQSGDVAFSYDNTGRVIGRQLSDGGRERYEYDDEKNIVRKTAPDGGISVIRWSSDYLKQEITDPLGNKTVIEYDKNGMPERFTGPTGASSEIRHDALGRTVFVKDPAGRTTTFEYAGETSLVKSVTLPDGRKTLYTYDAHMNISSIKIGDTVVYSYSYTPDGLLESARGFRTPENRLTYYPDGSFKSAVNAIGAETLYEHDKRGNIISVKNALGGVTRYSYDGMDRLASKTDPAGSVTTFGYDAKDRLESITYPDGGVLRYGFDAAGRIASRTDKKGRTTRYEYDNAGRVVKITHWDQGVGQYRYDPAGNLVEMTGKSGQTTKYRYDTLGRVISQIRPSGLEITYQYDESGKLIGRKDNQGGATGYRYDAGDRITRITDGLGAATEYKYDPLDSLIAITDPLGNTKKFFYDATGLLTAVREPNGYEARYEYDRAGNLTTGHSPAGGVIYFGYDPAGDLISERDPLGNEQHYGYDAGGRLIRKTKASGQSIALSYDRSGRLTGEKSSDGRSVGYTYDSQGNRTEANDGKFPVVYRYDGYGRISGIEYSALNKAIGYEYEGTGLRSRLIMPDGKDIRYEYDTFRRLSALVLPGGGKVRFSYDAKGREDKIIYPNGVAGVFAYDPSDRIVNIAYGPDGGRAFFSERYTYDAAGSVIQREANGKATQYRYDPSRQLIGEAGAEGSSHYSYGPGGNRSELKRDAGTVTYEYDKADRMIRAEGATLGYDADGNLVSRKGAAAESYEYDVDNRLVKAAGPDSGEVSYGYDPSGKRVWRRDKKGTTYFMYDGLNLVQEIGEKPDARATFVYAPGIDHPVAMLREGKTFYYHADRLGSIRCLTDDQGAVAAAYDYDAFGKVTRQEGTINNPFTFTAREIDPATGLYYFRARYYDPGPGRFLSYDPELPPKSEPIGMNPYLYVKNDPVNEMDPMGLDYTPAQRLWMANDSYEEELAQAEKVGKPGGFAENAPPAEQAKWRNDYLESAERFKAKAESLRSEYPGVEPEPPPGYGGRPFPTASAAGEPSPGGPAPGSPAAKGPTLAVKPGEAGGPGPGPAPGAKGPGTIKISPGGAAEPTPEPVPSPTTGEVTSGIGKAGGVLGAIASYVNLKACIDEGHSSAYCYAQAGVGLVGGAVVGGTVVAGATLAGVPATVIAVTGTTLAAGGTLLAGNRWSNAPVVKAQAEQQATQQGQQTEHVQNALANLNAQKAALLAAGTAFCNAQTKVHQDADKAKDTADQAKKDSQAALDSMSANIADQSKKCDSAKEMIQDLQPKIDQVSELTDNANEAFDEAESSLSGCSSQKDIDYADAALQAATAYALSAGGKGSQAASDIQSLKSSIPDIQQSVNDLKSRMSAMENNYAANMEAVNTSFSNATADAADANKALTDFNTRKAALVQSATNLSGVIPPSFASDLASILQDASAASLPCPNKLDEYVDAAKSAHDSVNIAKPTDIGSLLGMASMAPQALQKLNIDTLISNCSDMKAPTGGEEGAEWALDLAQLQNDMPEKLATILDLRNKCVAQLNAPAHVLTSFNVTCAPSTINVGQSSTCTASGVYGDKTGETVDLTASATWNQGPTVTGTSAGSLGVTASFQGSSGTATVSVQAAPPSATQPIVQAAPPTATQHGALVAFRVQCAPSTINVGQSSTCTASGIYEDQPDTAVDLTGQAAWNQGPTVTGTSPGSLGVSASVGGLSDTATVTVTAAVAGGGYNPNTDVNKTSPQTGGSSSTLPSNAGMLVAGVTGTAGGSGSIGAPGVQPQGYTVNPTGDTAGSGTGGQAGPTPPPCPRGYTPVTDAYGNVSCAPPASVIPPPRSPGTQWTGPGQPPVPGGTNPPTVPGGTNPPIVPGTNPPPTVPGGTNPPPVIPGGTNPPIVPGTKPPTVPGGTNPPTVPGAKGQCDPPLCAEMCFANCQSFGMISSTACQSACAASPTGSPPCSPSQKQDAQSLAKVKAACFTNALNRCNQGQAGYTGSSCILPGGDPDCQSKALDVCGCDPKTHPQCGGSWPN